MRTVGGKVEGVAHLNLPVQALAVGEELTLQLQLASLRGEALQLRGARGKEETVD